MVSFRNRVVDGLNRIYAFIGGQVTLDSFDLNGQLQPVHDVSREAELSAGLGSNVAPGLFFVQATNAHVGSDTLVATVDPRTTVESAPSQFAFPSSLEYDVWMLDAWVFSATTAIMSAGVGVILYPPLPGSTQSRARAFLTFDAGTNMPDAANTANGDSFGSHRGGQAEAPVPFLTRPQLLPLGTIVQFQSTALAVAGSITLTTMCWAGPRGARPPGLA